MMDKYTGEIIDRYPRTRRATRPRARRAKRNKPTSWITQHHEGFIALAAVLGLWIAISR